LLIVHQQSEDLPKGILIITFGAEVVRSISSMTYLGYNIGGNIANSWHFTNGFSLSGDDLRSVNFYFNNANEEGIPLHLNRVA
jgi:hypothetical protein